VALPHDALGATVTTKSALCSASMRTKPSTSARRLTTVATRTKVTVVARVTGGSWRVSCGGKTVSGKYWYRISAINGKSVKSLYGVTYVYAASGLFVASSITKYAACSVYLRASASRTATARVLIKTNTKVTIVARVTGSSWSKSCAGRALSGSSWYRISRINGTSVKSLYGVSYVYAPSGLFKASATASAAAPVSSGQYLFGTLLTDANRSTGEAAAGVKVVQLELSWKNYEPTEGTFNSTYINQMRQRLATMRAAGLKVVLGAGLQYPPGWAFAYPNSRYVNQYGATSGELNLTFNATLRTKAARYLARIDADFDLDSFWAVRVGAGGNIETLYPSHTADGAHSNAYWAYDPAAQASSPFPGWKPGQTTFAGRSFTTADVRTWYDWYVGALVDGVDWQLATYRSLGFSGFLQVLLPGQGTRPLDYARGINTYLDGSADGNRTMSRGAAWDRVLGGIADKRNVVAYVSSMADGSGWNDVCQSGDSGVALTSSAIGLWSAARWTSYLADRYGLAKNGENPGANDTNSYGTAMLDSAAAQMRSCGFQGLMWAHDINLYSSTSGITLADYSRVIRAN